jgi:hypothetical protein
VIGPAVHFVATVEWATGECSTRCLSDTAPSEEVERLKYLPQDHVEDICNQLIEAGNGSFFENELKTVIFSHVPNAERLAQASLDDLIRFQTAEKQKRIDALVKQLREVSRERTRLEALADPASKREIEEKIKRRELEIQALDQEKPAAVSNPGEIGDLATEDRALSENIAAAESEKKGSESRIARCEEELSLATHRHAIAGRLLEKLSNFAKEADLFVASLADDSSELVLDSASLVSVKVDASRRNRYRNALGSKRRNSEDGPA